MLHAFAKYQVSSLTAWSVRNGACSNREIEKIDALALQSEVICACLHRGVLIASRGLRNDKHIIILGKGRVL